MASLNKVELIGNLGQDPEIRATQDGREIANLSIATSQSWKDKNTGEKREKTEWHRVVIFSEGLVKVVKNYLKKGSKVYIEGSLQTRKWTDKSGVEKYTTEIVMQGFGGKLIMLDGRKDSDQNQNHAQNAEGNQDFINSANKSEAANYTDPQLDDEIPF